MEDELTFSIIINFYLTEEKKNSLKNNRLRGIFLIFNS
jgi:hypothetical protein